MVLPDFDDIDGLAKRPGIFRFSRWPNIVGEQIEFLKQVSEKFGSGSTLSVTLPGSDGVGGNGYVSVVPETKIRAQLEADIRERSNKASGLAKLTLEERKALRVG